MTDKDTIEEIIESFKKLPGINARSAKNLVLYLLNNNYQLKNLIKLLHTVESKVSYCKICGNLDLSCPCYICSDQSRDNKKIAVVSSISELWAIEKSCSFKGKYHVLGTNLSIVNDSSLESLRLNELKERCVNDAVEEVIITCNYDLEGQATAQYIKEYLSECNLLITKPATGIPIGSEIHNMDESTITAALISRKPE